MTSGGQGIGSARRSPTQNAQFIKKSLHFSGQSVIIPKVVAGVVQW